jgi:tyrosine-protein kinase Etk/Wzc
MNNTKTPDVRSDSEFDQDEVSVFNLLIVLAKHKKLVIGLPVAAMVLSGALSFALPDQYKATTKLLPPQQAQSGAAAMLSQLGGAAGLAGGLAGLKSPNDLYIGMLKSRTVADGLIAKFNLKNVYDTSFQELARKKLEDQTTISSGKDGLITIEVENPDRKLVAKLTNAYVDQLFGLTKVLAVTEASQRRVFFERQLEMAKNNLAQAEISLKGALDTHGVISVDTESRAILETVGRLRAQVSAKEIELGSMRAFLTVNNPSYRRTEEELGSLRAELSKLENGRPQQGDATDSNKPGLNNIKLLRDVKYNQMLYELLAKQYEIARLDEAKEPSVIQVLDQAVEPERKSNPKRALIVLIATLFAGVAGVALAFLFEAKQRAALRSGDGSQWDELKGHLRSK